MFKYSYLLWIIRKKAKFIAKQINKVIFKNKQKKIAVIIAREEVKEYQKKISKVFRKPIIEIVIKTIKSTKIFDEIIISTDDNNIAKVAKNKIKVPFIRPKNLANDFADTYL